MKRAGETQTATRPPLKAPSRIGRRAIKLAAWTLAIPALCAAALIGGAAPLYLLLPDAKPPVEVARNTAPAAPMPSSRAPTVAVEQAAVVAGDEIDEVQTRSTAADPAPDENGADPLAETAVAAVVPTPRPATPRPYTRPLAAGAPSEAAVAVSPTAPRESAVSATEPREASAPLEGRRTVVRTAAKLRAAPQGAEIGVLRNGAEIVVGRCDAWCEVSADGRRGFVHASLIDGTRQSAARAAKQRDEARRAARWSDEERDTATRRPAYDRPRYERRYERRGEDAVRADERRSYDRAYRRGVDPDWLQDDPDARSDEPDWYVENAPPFPEEEAPILFYEDPYR